MPRNLRPIGRRSVLRTAVAGFTGAVVALGTSACTPGTETAMPQDTADGGGRVLLACFSRAGENYHYGGRTNLDTGNTEVLAGMISGLIGCDVHRIEAAETYPDAYDAAVARNVREQDADARPVIANPLPSIDQYSTVLLASGIWNVRAPMIMATFAETYDFSGKTIHPVTTHAMRLAVRGEEVRDAGPAVESWLRRTGLLPS